MDSKHHTLFLAAVAGVLTYCSPVFAQRLVPEPMKRHLPIDDAGAARAMALVDYNGDGFEDVVVAQPGGLSVWQNDGLRTVLEERELFQTQSPIRDLVAFDADGDGDADLLTSMLDGRYAYYRQDANGDLVDQMLAQLPLKFALSDLQAGDVDGDGDVDVVAVSRDDQFVLVNDGTGAFASTAIMNFPRVLSSIALGDIDGDGDLDIAGRTFGGVATMVNDGLGTFSPGVVPMPFGVSTTFEFVALADVDVDGDLDLVGQDRNRMGLLLNDGTGQFVDVSSAQLPAGTDGQEFDVVDLNGDGAPEIVIAPRELVLLNDGVGRFVVAPRNTLPSESESVAHIVHGDFDNDGDNDLILNRESGLHSLHVNDGRGRFVDAARGQVPASTQGLFGGEIAAGDFNGDGRVDWIFSHPIEGVQVLIGQRDGSFVDAAMQMLPGFSGVAAALEVADMDGDGDSDVVFVQRGADVRVLENFGGGVFLVREISGSAAATPGDVAVGDIDGDGDNDIVVGTGWPVISLPIPFENPQILINQGAMSYSVRRLDPANTLPRVFAVELADIDGDTDLDLVLGTDDQDRAYINDGAGVLTDDTVRAMPRDVTSTNLLTVGDIDGDGDVDFYAGVRNVPASTGARVGRLLINDGTGAFTLGSSILPAVVDNVEAAEFTDFDMDGDLDLVTAGLELRAFVNVGGVLREATTTLFGFDPVRAFDVTAVDLGQDGDTDLIIGAGAYGSVLMNGNRRTLRAPLLARAGFEYRLELSLDNFLRGRPVFLLSPRLAPTPIPTIVGSLELDPTSIVVIPATPGTATRSLMIPASTSLVGVELHWQAAARGLADPTLRLTNLVSDTVLR